MEKSTVSWAKKEENMQETDRLIRQDLPNVVETLVSRCSIMRKYERVEGRMEETNGRMGEKVGRMGGRETNP
jgi:hypothetical protein